MLAKPTQQGNTAGLLSLLISNNLKGGTSWHFPSLQDWKSGNSLTVRIGWFKDWNFTRKK